MPSQVRHENSKSRSEAVPTEDMMESLTGVYGSYGKGEITMPQHSMSNNKSEDEVIISPDPEYSSHEYMEEKSDKSSNIIDDCEVSMVIEPSTPTQTESLTLKSSLVSFLRKLFMFSLFIMAICLYSGQNMIRLSTFTQISIPDISSFNRLEFVPFITINDESFANESKLYVGKVNVTAIPLEFMDSMDIRMRIIVRDKNVYRRKSTSNGWRKSMTYTLNYNEKIDMMKEYLMISDDNFENATLS